eukprot:4079298-Alexandrium_andersonii.AAC.1
MCIRDSRRAPRKAPHWSRWPCRVRAAFRQAQPGRRVRVRRAGALPRAAGRRGPEREPAVGVRHVAWATLGHGIPHRCCECPRGAQRQSSRTPPPRRALVL